jgi:hypothetical protein
MHARSLRGALSRLPLLALFAAMLCAPLVATPAAAAPAAASTGAQRPAAPSVLLDPKFAECERQGFVALASARRALVLNEAREKVLENAGSDAEARRMVDALFAARARGERDHGRFAAREFRRCLTRARLPQLVQAADEAQAAACLTRLDVVHFAVTERTSRKTEPQVQASTGARFAEAAPAIPPALVAVVVPAVFRLRDDNDRYSLEQIVFESCLFPEQWNARVAALPAASGARTPAGTRPQAPAQPRPVVPPHAAPPHAAPPHAAPHAMPPGTPALPPRHPPIPSTSPHG